MCFAIAGLLAALVCWPATVFSQPGDAVQCSKLVVSGNPEYPPLLWVPRDTPKVLVGAVPQFLKEVVKPLGLEVEVRNIGSWARVQRLAELGELDLVAGAFITSERITYMDYVLPPMVQLPTNVWVRRDKVFQYRHWPDLVGKRGSTLINNSFGQNFDSFAEENLDILGVRSIEQSYLMAEIGRVDFVLYELLQGKVKLERLGLEADFVALAPPVSKEGLFFAFPKKSRCNNEPLREAFMDELLALKRAGRFEQLIDEYAEKYVREVR
ncbi:substrate-binding periplasmic protein [Marinobacter fuscus]|uniref:substrate-binding periplasmic protein n=1 Tax=Marinobacter fuscus TaxID=2109942 RepID=UPI001F0C723C|nr:transporter substrate-binding domain-containing protein [Marinobacter fuscus]